MTDSDDSKGHSSADNVNETMATLYQWKVKDFRLDLMFATPERNQADVSGLSAAVLQEGARRSYCATRKPPDYESRGHDLVDYQFC